MRRARVLRAYLLLVGLPLAVLVAVLKLGRTLSAPPLDTLRQGTGATAAAAPMNLFTLVLQVAVVLLVSRAVGMLFGRFGQPQVVGEMVAGILLGPSLLGWAAPGFSEFIFPPSSLGYLNGLSQIGLVLFMFLVGVSLNPKELREHGRTAILTSHASIVAPFCLGAALALLLYPRLSRGGITFPSFALFMGSAMSITAFPVLARILAERNLLSSRMGTLSISCAAVDDVTGWCILAYIVVLVRVQSAAVSPWSMAAGSIAYIIVMLTGVKRFLLLFEKSFRRRGRITENALSLLIVLALASALTTERLGIHSVFGAFFFGAILPKSTDFTRALRLKLESMTTVALLPLFFAYSGLRTSINTVHGTLWIYTLLVIVVAVAGKVGGSMLAARMSGTSWTDASALGILMNTRGLMELVALNIGLDIGVISSSVFTIMVLMALVTTFMTSPLLARFYPASSAAPEEDLNRSPGDLGANQAA
jgi:Kef-type K+ transport system membrane component KefB